MSDPVADYLAGVDEASRALAEHYYAQVRELVPGAAPARKYAMACYAYRGKGLVAVMVTKTGISLVPFSGSINRVVAGEYALSEGGGSLYCSVERPFPDDRFAELLRLRMAEIDAKAR